MDDFSVKAFGDVFNKSRRIDYIASCTSEWHLISTIAFLDELYEKSRRNLTGIIILCEHGKNGYIIRESLLNLHSKYGANFYKRDKDTKVSYNTKDILRGMLLTQNNKLYIISVVKPWLKMSLECRKIFQCKIVNIIIDEGAGCYSPIYTRILLNYKEWGSMRRAIYNFYFEIFTYGVLWLVGIPIKNHYLLYKKRRKLTPNKLVLKYFKKVVKELPRQEIMFRPMQPYALLLVQPLKEQGCTNVDAVLQCFDTIRERCNTAGITLYVKLHPRYDSKEYKERGFDIVNDRIGVENLLASTIQKPEFVCGFNTTGLITAGLLYGIRSYSLNDLILEDRNIGDKYFRESLKRYDKQFEGVVPKFSYDYLKSYGEVSC